MLVRIVALGLALAAGCARSSTDIVVAGDRDGTDFADRLDALDRPDGADGPDDPDAEGFDPDDPVNEDPSDTGESSDERPDLPPGDGDEVFDPIDRDPLDGPDARDDDRSEWGEEVPLEVDPPDRIELPWDDQIDRADEPPRPDDDDLTDAPVDDDFERVEPELDSGGSSPLTPSQDERLQRFLSASFGAYVHPSLSVAVFDAAGVRAHYGFTRNAGVPPDLDTVYRVGGVTQTFAAAEVLAENVLRPRAVDLSDRPVIDYLPELTEALVYEGRSPSVGEIVTHRSGWIDSTALPYYGAAPVSLNELIAVLGAERARYAPGTRAVFSNNAFALIGPILERAGGGSLRNRLQAHFFDPLGLTSAVWEARAVPGTRLARGHWLGLSGYEAAQATFNLGVAEGLAGLYLSARDAARWGAFQLRAVAGNVDPGVPLTPDWARRALEPPLAGSIFAWGWFTDALADRSPYHVITGSTIDYAAYLAFVPAYDMGVAVLVGAGDTRGAQCYMDGAFNILLSPGAPPPCAPAFDDPLNTAFDALIDAMRTPTDAVVRRTFDPTFLERFSLDRVRGLLQRYGELCRERPRVAPLNTLDPHTGRARFTCDGGTFVVLLTTYEGFANPIYDLSFGPIQPAP